METNYPIYFRSSDDIMLFQSPKRGIMLAKSFGKYAIKEIAIDEEWIRMFMEEGEEVTKDEFATMLIKAFMRFETYYSPELMDVEVVCEGFENTIAKVYKKAI